MASPVKIEEISNRIYVERMNGNFAYLDEKTLDTVLEDMHILKDDGYNDLELPAGNKISESFDKLCNIMDTIGYTTTSDFFNTLRMFYNPNVKHDFDMNIENILSFVQKSIFAFNTKQRNNRYVSAA